MDLHRQASMKTLASTNDDSRIGSTVSSTPSDKSWSPSMTASTSPTSPSSSHQSPPLLSAPRTPRRYPSDLSRRVKPRNPQTASEPEEPRTYQSLEDLLRVHGFKETRVFTPESERAEAAAEEARLRNALKEGGESDAGVGHVGESVMSFLSGLIPGSGITLGRPKAGRDVGHAETTTEPSTEAEPSLIDRRNSRNKRRSASPLAHKTGNPPIIVSLESPSKPFQTISSLDTRLSPDGGLNRSLRRTGSYTSSSGAMTPSSSASTIRPSARQLLQVQRNQIMRKQSSPVLASPGRHGPRQGLTAPHPLRHATSVPNLTKSRADARHGRSQRPQRRHPQQRHVSPAPDTWLGTLTSFLTTTLQSTANVHHNLNNGEASASHKARSPSDTDSDPRSRCGSPMPTGTMPHLLQAVSANANASAEVATSNVFCRSAPSSRSTSRVRQEDGRRRKGKSQGENPLNLLTSPLLSPSLASDVDDPIALLWDEGFEDDAAVHFSEYQQSKRGRVDSDPEPPNLEDILASRPSIRRENSKAREPRDERDVKSLAVNADLAAQRQRSIRSLRATLAACEAASANISSSVPNNRPDGPSTRKPHRGRVDEHIPPVPQLPPQFRITSPGGTSSDQLLAANGKPSNGLRLPNNIAPDPSPWLEGPEWETSQGNAAQKKRALLPFPWRGSTGPSCVGAEQAWEEPDSGRAQRGGR